MQKKGKTTCFAWTDKSYTQADDWLSAIVTRADWETERAKLKAPKANGDGWIRHRGGKCPVADGMLVDVRYRGAQPGVDGYSPSGKKAGQYHWRHDSGRGDIMAYRIHKPAEQPCPVETKAAERKCEGRNCKMPDAENHSRECLLDAAIDQCWAGPLEWRDRIRELDTQRAEIESTYQRQISEITQERESLVQKLAGEGLALVEVVVQPVEDMSDFAKWRVGDLVQVIDPENSGLKAGKAYPITELEDELSEEDPVYGMPCLLLGANTWLYSKNMRWHSRPAT